MAEVYDALKQDAAGDGLPNLSERHLNWLRVL
jgi:hypothetical protein